MWKTVRLMQGMYANARAMSVGEGYSEESEVNVGVQPAAFHHHA